MDPNMLAALAVEAPVLAFDPSTFLGPAGALAIALVAVAALWREDRRVYKERILDLRTQRDANAAGWKEQTDANADLARGQKEIAAAVAVIAAELRERP